MPGGNINDVISQFGADPNVSTQFGRIASIGQLRDFSATGPAGTSSYGPDGITSTGPGGDLYSLLSGLATTNANGGAQAGDVNNLLSGLFQTNGASPQSDQANSLFNNFATKAAAYDPNTTTQDMLGRLNAIAQPADQNAASTLANRLFSKGRLGGNDTGAGRAFGELAKQQDLAQQQRYLTAFGAGQTEATNLTSFANTFGQLGSNLQTSNLSNGIKLAATPGAIAGQNVQNAGAAVTAGNNALAPLDQQLARMFQGTSLSADQKQSIANALAGKLAANKTNGKNAGFSGMVTGAISGAQAGSAAGPWGALAGGIAGGAGGYYSSPAAGGGGAAGAGGGAGNMFGSLAALFKPSAAPAPTNASYDYGGGFNYPAKPAGTAGAGSLGAGGSTDPLAFLTQV